MSLHINIIPSHQINNIKWDNCITKSNNSLIYACSFYLNAVAGNWHGLVIDDYKAVMPLPWRKKYGIRYYYTPPFTQQSGLFGHWDEADENAVVQSVQAFARFGDYRFNHQNQFMNEITAHPNFILDLSAGYECIAENYKTDLVQNLKKAAKENLVYAAEVDAGVAIKLYQQSYADKTPHVTNKDYNNFLNLCVALIQTDQCLIRKATNPEGEIVAIALLLKDDHRIYNILNTTTDAGRKTEANHFLMDRIIHEFAGNKILFDFEGSDIPGVKSFYEKFGAVDQPYYHWHYNHLLWPLKLFKR